MGLGWLFPGQGSQRVGMGKALADRYASAARTFEEANDALGFDLRQLCFDGPEGELERTVNAQPALLVTSTAALRAAREEFGDALATPVAAAGHSLGEFSALVATGALAFADGLRLVRRRGELMQEADPGGAMLAVIGSDATTVARALDGTGWVVANDNAPGQTVISGPFAERDEVTRALTAAGARRAIALKVSGAFHSPAMRGVADALRREMERITFRDATIPVVSSVDAQARTRAADFADVLARQVYSPVRWVDVIGRMTSSRVDTFVEFGAGNVLAGLVRRIAPEAVTASVQDPTSLGEAAAVLR